MDLSDFNPWWKTGRVPAYAVGRKRKVFHETLPYLETRQVLLITGLRRVGKTIMMHQPIECLLDQGVDRYHVLYFSFDEVRQEPDAVLREFAIEILRKDLRDDHLFLFFDEIQKLKDWESKIKVLYDLHPRMKIILSGSAQITMWRGSRESLAGRFFDVRVEPLGFEEYLEGDRQAI